MVKNRKPQIGMPSDLRRVHRSLVLRNIFSSAGGSRTQLAEETALSAMAITRIIRELIDAELIEEIGKRDREGSPGRRRTGLQVKSSGAYVIGLVISAFGHEVAVLNAIGVPLAREKLIFDDIQGPDEAVEIASEAISSLIEDAQIDRNRVLGIGVAIAAFVRSATGTVVQAPYLGWKQFELGREITKRTGLPVIAENIADAINLAEQTIGTANGVGGVFLVHTSVACGASYIHEGSLIRGANFSAGQIGHLPAGKSLLVCSCGATDCLNTHASGWSVLANLERISSRTLRPENNKNYADALTELLAEDPEHKTLEGNVLFQAGRCLGRALRNVSLIVDPHAIVLAGKLPESSAYVAGCRAAWTELSAEQLRNVPALIVGTVMPIQAAGFLALDSFLYSPRLDMAALLAMGAQAEIGSVA